MYRFVLLCFTLMPVAMSVGCGSRSDTAPMAEQDELAKYAAENPAQENSEVSD